MLKVEEKSYAASKKKIGEGVMSIGMTYPFDLIFDRIAISKSV
jgi:hypothetical protein